MDIKKDHINFAVGPVQISEEISRIGADPVPYFRTPDFSALMKENEALLTLATNLFEQGDIERSYNYISSALSDANFYNSRVKNSVIARVQPIIESNYLDRI